MLHCNQSYSVTLRGESMRVGEMLILSLGLAMDAFAAAVCKGMAVRKMTLSYAIWVGAWFGAFQAGMPLLGYLLGNRFAAYIVRFDHWIALVMLSFLGVNMIREAKDDEVMDDEMRARSLLPLSIATSIDALAAGVTLAFLQTDIWRVALLIGLSTFLLSALGAYLGKALGLRFKALSSLTGGVILIIMGLKIFLEHTGIL